jgi:hypothetical protein
MVSWGLFETSFSVEKSRSSIRFSTAEQLKVPLEDRGKTLVIYEVRNHLSNIEF